MTHLTIIEHASAQALDWVRQIQAEMHLTHEKSAYAALRAVLHVLRDRLAVKEAADLASQMPTLVRGIYYEGWKPSTVPTKERTKDEFFQKISDELQDIRPINVQAAAEAVFRAFTRHVTEGETAGEYSGDLAPLGFPRSGR